VNAGEITVFKVKERIIEQETHQLRFCEREKIESFFGAKYINKAIRDQLILEIIPLKLNITTQQAKVNEETKLLNQAVNEQETLRTGIVNRMSSGAHFHSGQTLWLSNEVDDGILTSTQTMIDHEQNIRKYRASARALTETLLQNQNTYEAKLAKLQDEVVLIPK